MPNIGLELLEEKEPFKVRFELRLRVGWDPIWTRDSTEIHSWTKNSFLPKRKLKLKREILFKRNPLLFKRRFKFKKKISLPWFKKRSRKNMRKKLNQSLLWRLRYLMFLKSTLVLSIVLT